MENAKKETTIKQNRAPCQVVSKLKVNCHFPEIKIYLSPVQNSLLNYFNFSIPFTRCCNLCKIYSLLPITKKICQEFNFLVPNCEVAAFKKVLVCSAVVFPLQQPFSLITTFFQGIQLNDLIPFGWLRFFRTT